MEYKKISLKICNNEVKDVYKYAASHEAMGYTEHSFACVTKTAVNA